MCRELLNLSQTRLTVNVQNNPLHISVLPPHENLHFKFSLLLNSCLDIIELRQQHVSVDQDLGLLHVLDERFAAYGWLTNTSVKFIIIVDMMGNSDVAGAGLQSGLGLQQGDLKPVRIPRLRTSWWN